METYTDNHGTQWVTGKPLAYGPYGGGSSIACANITWLEEHGTASVIHARLVYLDNGKVSFGRDDGEDLSAYDAIIVGGSFGGKTAFINMDGALRENADALHDYPVFDDWLVSQVELEWEEQAWPDTLRDLLDAAPTDRLRDYFSDHADKFEGMMFQAYRDAMESTNTYPVPEYDSVYIDTDKIADDFWGNLLNAFKLFHKERWASKK